MSTVLRQVGSLPPVKARRRQNAIVNLNAVSKAASRSGARRDGRPQRDFVSLKKSARHLLVRTPLLTQLRIAGTLQIKAETVNQQTGYKTGWMPRCDFLRGIQIEGIKKTLRTCYLQRVRPAQHKPVGRDALFLRRKGFRGNQAHANAWAFCVLKGFAR